MRFFLRCFHSPKGVSGEILNELIWKKAELHFEISNFQEYFSHRSVSFPFLLKIHQIAGVLPETSNRNNNKKKIPKQLHLFPCPPSWHCIWKIAQRSHWSLWVCTITSPYGDVILWCWPLSQQLEIPLVQIPVQPLHCNPANWDKLNLFCKSSFSLLRRTI